MGFIDVKKELGFPPSLPVQTTPGSGMDFRATEGVEILGAKEGGAARLEFHRATDCSWKSLKCVLGA